MDPETDAFTVDDCEELLELLSPDGEPPVTLCSPNRTLHGLLERIGEYFVTQKVPTDAAQQALHFFHDLFEQKNIARLRNTTSFIHDCFDASGSVEEGCLAEERGGDLEHRINQLAALLLEAERGRGGYMIVGDASLHTRRCKISYTICSKLGKGVLLLHHLSRRSRMEPSPDSHTIWLGCIALLGYIPEMKFTFDRLYSFVINPLVSGQRPSAKLNLISDDNRTNAPTTLQFLLNNEEWFR